MAEATQTKWYIQVNGVEEGPMTSQTLRSLAKAGRISSYTPIRREGSTKTVPASKIKGLLTDSDQAHITVSQKALDEEDTMKDVVACRHCKKEVARTASVCPHCGGDNMEEKLTTKERKKPKAWQYILFFAILIFLVWLLTFEYSDSELQEMQRKNIEQIARTELLKEEIRDQMIRERLLIEQEKAKQRRERR